MGIYHMEPKLMNGLALAYMGDAIMSVFVREMLLSQGYQKSKVMQQKSEAWVSARAQANFLEILEHEQFFTDEEWSIVLRGRNTNPKSRAKNADVLTYRKATGLEAVFGYLYLQRNIERLDQLWNRIQEIGESL